ncbi:MAG: prolipoprotein diacylglyceryl transferase [Nanoarchaeota archaeon]|nr:prolipoprotein diacylglyceryl transferase [Nanoarchaeota archaeon]MBU1104029.1 prolipoprotein diacylglyceryl transferase [Nanoarchaeota archaeon]
MLAPNIDPIILKIGTLQISYYALVYIAGFLAVLFVIKNAIKEKELNLKNEQVYDLVIFLILGALLGARIFHILFWNLSYFAANPGKLFHVWEGGLSFHGGLFGALLAAAIYTKRKKINFWKLADLLTLPAIFFLALGRIANFINQEIVGTITNFPFCFNFKSHEGCRHPIQLYAAAARFALFFFLLYVKKSLKKSQHGFLFWLSIFGLGLGRFFLDFLREDAIYSGLKTGQWFSLVMVLVGIYALVKFHKKDLKYFFKNEPL